MMPRAGRCLPSAGCGRRPSGQLPTEKRSKKRYRDHHGTARRHPARSGSLSKSRQMIPECAVRHVFSRREKVPEKVTAGSFSLSTRYRDESCCWRARRALTTFSAYRSDRMSSRTARRVTSRGRVLRHVVKNEMEVSRTRPGEDMSCHPRDGVCLSEKKSCSIGL